MLTRARYPVRKSRSGHEAAVDTRPTDELGKANERKDCTVENKINSRLVVLAMLAATATRRPTDDE
jgi:hypothetical protein